ncbi:hypothetical protein Y032_0101g3334 [Ancylostoma ceylanicum]|uniref:Uncharacterized protein n=1 Tax=Ancylostoma ceylanicum TaxID=53326 RepID=A0A016THJ5_9BILA|nr:hypothetical protein Y032_0101g3334 [Ancylostoma ceylanicum]
MDVLTQFAGGRGTVKRADEDDDRGVELEPTPGEVEASRLLHTPPLRQPSVDQPRDTFGCCYSCHKDKSVIPNRCILVVFWYGPPT